MNCHKYIFKKTKKTCWSETVAKQTISSFVNENGAKETNNNTTFDDEDYDNNSNTKRAAMR